MLTSTPSSSCGAGRPAALLWLRLGEPGCQSKFTTPVITVLANGGVRCPGDLGGAHKPKDVAVTDGQRANRISEFCGH